MKKNLILFIVCISLFAIFPVDVSAKSIQDYKNEIAKIKADKAKSDEKTAEIDEQISAAREKINEITRNIAQVKKTQESTKEEISDLEKEIENKEEEIKNLVAFYQVSDSENFYLKFVFGADSFEDFIYRFSVAEQLTEANDKLVEEMNNLIEKNEEKIVELENQQKKLDQLNGEYLSEINKLGTEKEEYVELSIDYDDQIAAVEKLISYYRKKGCSDSEDISVCAAANVPSDSGFIRPLDTGCVWGLDSEYGGRIHPIDKIWKFHAGFDITDGSIYGRSVKAVAAGKVVLAGWWGNAGNAVVINHVVNGKNYHTIYMHLSSIAVSLDDIVTQGQTIGAVGSTGASSGAHLHLETLTGHFEGWYINTTFNPRNIINFPTNGSCW